MAADFKGLNSTAPPAMPFWWFIVQCVICGLGLGLFIVACYCIHVVPGGGPQAFLLVDALLIWIIVGGFIAIQRFQPSLYHRIAFIVSYALLIIFVLSAWAWSADVAGAFLAYSGFYRSYEGFGAGLAVGAALGAIVWVMLIVSLVFYVMASMKDGGGDGVVQAHDAEMGAVKTEQPAVAPQQAYPPQEPQQYEQYPPQQQQELYPPQQEQQYPSQQDQQYPPQQQQQYPPNPQQGAYHQ